MSVAFTKESDSEAVAADLPDRPISNHVNYVTPVGLAALDCALAKAHAAVSAARAIGDISVDRTAMARATRDLRYYSSRRASAQLVEPSSGVTVSFGAKVMIEREGGRRQNWQITGEDEANPSQGKLSYVSPMARALIGKAVGDFAQFVGQEVEIIGIDRGRE